MNISSTSVYLVAAALLLALATACVRQSEPQPPPEAVASAAVPAFANIAPAALGSAYLVSNYRPGAAVFDFDRDGDLDFYITQEAGKPNRLFRNDGNLAFTDVAAPAGVEATAQGSSGAAACDVDNDGYQDLYVGGRGVQGDGLDFRSADDDDLRAAHADRLFMNRGDGSFEDATDTALGGALNLRSAATVLCADADNDGWLDIFVANLIDEDYFFMGEANHPGHFDVMLHNQADGSFEDVSESAGVRGDSIWMRDPQGEPLTFTDESGASFEGYDPSLSDERGNRVGDPTGPTHAAVFFDYNDDSLPDLWVGTDGDFLKVYENRSTRGEIRFEPVERRMGFARVGNWMGFAVGDYDADARLDVFATNAGYHLRMRAPQPNPGPDCKYHERFWWGSCLNALLSRSGGGGFADVAPSTSVEPSALMPPDSLDAANIHPSWPLPTGLSAYDFGYGATFFDMDNDGYEDLYWLGSELAAGDGPGGDVYPAAGRMMRNRAGDGFEDVTVEARLLDVMGVRYDEIEPGKDPLAYKLSAKYHENGKGLAHGDLNGDGSVDLIGTNSSGLTFAGDGQQFEKTLGPTFVWINQPVGGSWITLRLKGRMAIDGGGSNADGIGARVYLTTTVAADGKPLTQVREVKAGSSYLSMDSVELEFGLGSATVVDSIEVHWPSGRRQTLTNVDAERVLEVVEPEE